MSKKNDLFRLYVKFNNILAYPECRFSFVFGPEINIVLDKPEPE